jgi:hypothetical protein
VPRVKKPKTVQVQIRVNVSASYSEVVEMTEAELEEDRWFGAEVFDRYMDEDCPESGPDYEVDLHELAPPAKARTSRASKETPDA